MQDNKFAGICVDFEEPPAAAQGNLLTFMQELHTTFAAKGLLVVQAVPFDDPDWNYKAYSAATDYLILMAYDQHWTGSDAGPVAAQDWFEQNLVKRNARSRCRKNDHRARQLRLRLERRQQ